MTHITVEVPYDKDLSLLLALLERLNLRIVDKSIVKEEQKVNLETKAFILKGLPARKDIEAFIRDFEESKLDRPFPDSSN